jgi:hypothetical protein
MTDNANTQPDDDSEDLVPMYAYVTKKTRKRARVLAAQSETTMRKLTDNAFMRGFELLEAEQREKEAAEEAVEEKAE